MRVTPRKDVFFGNVRGSAGEERVESAQELLVHGSDGHDLKTNRQVLSQCARVAKAVIGRKRTGHGDTRHVFPTHSIRCDDGGQRRIDTAAQPQKHPAEAALLNIVPCPQNESFVDRLALIG
jgi:hypothetical protein